MKRSLLIIILLVLLFSPLPVRAQGQTSIDGLLDEQMPALLAEHHVPGAVIAYIRDGEVAWTHAYGVANTRTGAPMQPEMILNFGSCGKVLTAWGVMRLVEAGQIELDAPVNQYLKRWQIESSQYDPREVTVRRLLSHTGGLSAPGFSDYSQGRRLPTLVEMLEGKNQGDERVFVANKPGTQFAYSGGGFVLLQMMIEDVTGESFEDFMQREVAEPLGLDTLRWTWTPELEQAAAMPHASQGEPVGYRQLASAAIGSELLTTADFARFIAAAVAGPKGEPAGRGALSAETVGEMTTVQANTNGTSGLAYGLATIGGHRVAMHFGSNLGWQAFFMLDLDNGEGMVVGANSANAFSLLTALQNLWTQNVLGEPVHVYPTTTSFLGMQGWAALIITALLGVPLLIMAGVFVLQLRSGRRKAAGFRARNLLTALPWLLLALFWWYWIYSPSQGLLPTNIPDVWRLPQAAFVLGVLLAWVALSVVKALFPKQASLA